MLLAFALAGKGQDVSNLVSANYFAAASASELMEDAGEVTSLYRKKNLLLTEADVDGREGLFIVDTGAPGLILNTQEFEVAAQKTQVLHGVTGSTSFQQVTVEHLRVDRLSQAMVPALLVDLSHLSSHLGVPVLGIIGHAQLKDFPVELSVRRNELSFLDANEDHLATTRNSTAYAFSLEGHLPVLSAKVGDHALDFAFDTGSGVNLIDAEYLNLLKDNLRGRPAKRMLEGIDSNPTEVTCALVRLTFLEEKEYKDKAFLFSDLSVFEAADLNVEGVLSPTFWNTQDFVLDYENGIVIFEQQ